MKEQEPNGKDELTRQDNQPRLNGEGVIFMAENDSDEKSEVPRGNSEQRGNESVSLGSQPQKTENEETTDSRKTKSFSPGPRLTDDEKIKDIISRMVKGDDPTAEVEYKAMLLSEQVKMRQMMSSSFGPEKTAQALGFLEGVSADMGELAVMGKEIYGSMERRREEASFGELPKNQLEKIIKTIRSLDSLEGIVTAYKEEKERRKSDPRQLHSETEIGILKELIFFANKDYVGKGLVDLSKKNNLKKRLENADIILEKIINAKDPSSVIEVESFKKLIEELIKGNEEAPGLKDIFRGTEEENENQLPRCLEDLMETIMGTEIDEFKTGREFGLLTLNEETGKEEVDVANFTAWIRSKILYWHDFNSTSEINLFSEIAVYKLYRSINFGEMLYDPRYFMTREKTIDKDGRVQTVYKRDKKFEELRSHLLYEVWLFMISHNADIKYRNIMGNDSKIPETVIELYYNNYFTNSDSRLLNILKLPDINSDDFMKCIKTEDEEQGRVGKAIRRALLAYYNIGEIGFDLEEGVTNMFEEALGGQNGEGTKEFYRQIYKKVFEKEDYPQDLAGLKKAVNEGLISLGHGKKGKKNSGLKELNIFNSIEKDTKITKWVREAMARAVAKAEKLTDIKDDFGDDSYLSSNIGYAESWAFSMTYWTGLAARNDTSAVGFDGWSKLQNTLGYRISQEGSERGGKGNYGDVFNFFGLDRISLNFWEGIKAKGKDGKEHSLLYFLQGGAGETIKLESIENFTFKSNVQRQFAINHLGYGYKVYEFLMKKHGLGLPEILSHDSFGKVVVDEEKAREKLWDGIYKQIRYAYDIQEFKWREKERGILWYVDKESGKPVPRFITTELEQLVFQPEVLETAESMMERYVEKDPQLKDKNYKARGVFAFLLEKELREHRKFFSADPIRRYTPEEVITISNYFRNRAVRIEKNSKGEAVVADTFFSKKEWARLAKKSKTEFSRMFIGKIGTDSIYGGFSGLIEALKSFFKEFLRF